MTHRALLFARAASLTSLAALVLTLSVAPVGRARADQVVVTDVMYEHSATTTTDSHYRVDPSAETPADLTTPVDYASGSAVVRLEVFTKPSDEPTRFQVCFEARPTYACTDQAPPYTSTGVYTWETSFADFYQGDMVDWSMGTGRVALILKDTMNQKPAPENVGDAYSALFFPTQLRVTVTLVSPGSTYVDPTIVPDGGVADADGGAIGDDAGTSTGEDGGGRTPPRDGGAPASLDAGAEAPGDVSGGCAVALSRRGAPLWLVALLFALVVRSRARGGRRSRS